MLYFTTFSPKNFGPSRSLKFVILLGIVSLFADVTYEGSRSIIGPFLATLGASGAVVGIVAGFGELIGYALRIVSGYITDKTQRYWAITIVGYAVNLFAVPLLAFAGNWQIAAFLIILERFGKAIRTPARDAMLSYATHQMGRGKGFGLHEAMDQIGAVLGPLVVAAALYARGEYKTGFMLLLIPAFIALATLIIAKVLYPRPRELEVKKVEIEPKGFQKPFWIYLLAIGSIAAGYADFSLISFHFERAGTIPAAWIPLFYAAAMGIDALAALIFGRYFDKVGFSILIVAVVLSVFFAPLVFLGGLSLAFVGVLLWGIGMGAQESVMRAAVAEMVPPDRRGAAYGVFNTGYGLLWFAGSALMGFLYDISIPLLVGFSVAAQLASIPLLILIHKKYHLQKDRNT